MTDTNTPLLKEAERRRNELKAAREKDETAVFDRYAYYATNLRNWFVAFGVGAIYLLTQATSALTALPASRKAFAIALFLAGLASQAALALLNKVIHYYAYQSTVVEGGEEWRHRVSNKLVRWFWLDLLFDLSTMALYVWAIVDLAYRVWTGALLGPTAPPRPPA